ncbi:MAG TPA: cytochrome P450 [Thermomicrobiales bacterium]|jgi:cytochrome P450
MTDRPPPDWDPRDPSVLRDQPAAYDQMRERCPVAYSEFLGWSLFRHGDVTAVLSDPETYSSASRHLAVPNGMDPPEHTLYRRVLLPHFGPDRMSALEPQCRHVATDLVRALLARGVSNFVAEFAHPFPLRTLCLFVGWPVESWEYLHGWTHGNLEASLSHDRARAQDLARGFTEYVETSLREHRAAGDAAPDDLLTNLIRTEVAGRPLSDEEIVSLLRNWTAGQGTVGSALGNLVFFLAEHPQLQQQLREAPATIPAAIEELLRVDGPLVANRRTVARDVAIEGRQIGAGERLTLMWIAANRDGRAFADPEAVRFDRDQGANLLFGAGIHDCIGAPLARLQMRIALEEMLARTTEIQIDRTAPVKPAVYPGNGFLELPVRLT